MFEDESYDVIKKRMLDRIPSSLDKQQTGVPFNAIAPTAFEIARMKTDNDTILKETFAKTSNRESLVKRAAESGFIPYPASKAICKGEFYNGEELMDVEIGSRFTCGNLIYKATEKISTGIYKMTCETAGAIGNTETGTLIPVEYVENLSSAELTEILVPGEDEEETEVFRNRYLNGFNDKAYGGNKADYIAKVNAISGVGACKPERIVNETSPILITIVDSTYGKASDALVEIVQNTIDPHGNGDGEGIAPYNHIVNIQSATENEVSIYLDAVYDTGYDFDSLKTQIENKIKELLLSLRQDWANQTNLVVRLAIVQSEILTIEGILDINEIKINGEAANLVLTKYEIPVFNEVTNE